MSPRSIGSQRYTNLLTKMRSSSSSDGIMLVPSTFTGWYRKMMMKAEIASDMNRSRNQTARIGNVRTELGGAGVITAGVATASGGLDEKFTSGIAPHCSTNGT